MNLNAWEKLAADALERAEKATPPPWLHYDSTRWDDRRACGYDSRGHDRGAPYYCTGPSVDSDSQASVDARFIAHARADVPALAAALRDAVDDIRRLREENERLTRERDKPRSGDEAAGDVESGLLKRVEQLADRVPASAPVEAPLRGAAMEAGRCGLQAGRDVLAGKHREPMEEQG